jgi:hypothetical protein
MFQLKVTRHGNPLDMVIQTGQPRGSPFTHVIDSCSDSAAESHLGERKSYLWMMA